MNIKKHILKTGFPFLLLILLFTSCENPADGNVVRTGEVRFINESSYSVNVRHGSLAGPILLSLSIGGHPGSNRTIDVRISDDQHGIGTTFAVEYLHRINDMVDAFDPDMGDIFASGFDFNVQMNIVIEEGRSHTVQIPQPQYLEFRNAFITIHNTHNNPAELMDAMLLLRQAGNNNVTIPSGRIGVYRLDGISDAGAVLRNLNVVSGFAVSTPVPEFTAMNGIIYNFIFNGTSVTPARPPQQTIVF